MSKFVLDKKGVSQLLRGEEMQGILTEYGNKVMKGLNSKDYNAQTSAGVIRANVTVVCATKKALSDNLKNNTLLKALGGVKGD